MVREDTYIANCNISLSLKFATWNLCSESSKFAKLWQTLKCNVFSKFANLSNFSETFVQSLQSLPNFKCKVYWRKLLKFASVSLFLLCHPCFYCIESKKNPVSLSVSAIEMPVLSIDSYEWQFAKAIKISSIRCIWKSVTCTCICPWDTEVLIWATKLWTVMKFSTVMSLHLYGSGLFPYYRSLSWVYARTFTLRSESGGLIPQLHLRYTLIISCNYTKLHVYCG